MRLEIVKWPYIFSSIFFLFISFFFSSCLAQVPLLFGWTLSRRVFVKLVGDTVICQMCKLAGALWVKVLDCKSDVAFFIYKHSEWIPISYQNPLSDVKLFLIDNKRVFNVFLDHPMSSFAFFDIFQDLVVFGKNCNPSASTLMTWLHDPQVLFTIYTILGLLIL